MKRVLSLTVAVAAACAPAGDGATGADGAAAEVVTTTAATTTTTIVKSSVADGACVTFNPVPPTDRIFNGWLTVPPFEPVFVDLESPIDWAVDPYDHPSWRMGFHSLDFLWPSLSDDNLQRTDHIDEVQRIIADWIAHNPIDDPPSDFSWNDHSTAKRTRLMSCAYATQPIDWLAEAIAQHAIVLKDDDFYRGHTNHGISQDIALLTAGCVLDSQDLIEVAESRAREASSAKVDSQGVLDEQSPGYQSYVLRLYRWFAGVAEACGRSITRILPDLDLMAEVVADARMPDGRLVPLGDTYLATRANPTKTAERTRVYDAGFVFGRSGETFYALRFGPGKYIHGHDDHTSIYLYAHGAPRLAEGGHVGYEQTPFRRYLQGPTAHNVVVVDDGDYDRSAYTQLVSSDGHSFTLRDAPYEGVERERNVVFDIEEPRMTVTDVLRSDGPHTYRQLWHLPPPTVVHVEGNVAVATFDDGVEMRITQAAPVDRITIVEGQTEPYLGWTATGHGVREPSPVVVSEIHSSDASFHTVISFERDSKSSWSGSNLSG